MPKDKKPRAPKLPEYTKLRSEEPTKFPDQFVSEERRAKFEKGQLDLLQAVAKAKRTAAAFLRDIDSERSKGKPIFKEIQTEKRAKNSVKLL